METIEVKGELLFELANKQEWIRKVPGILPEKTRMGEQWLWINKNGNVFECGKDFAIAEELDTYPCKVYRLISVTVAKQNNSESTLDSEYELKFCEKCFQMTNHLEGTCQKCKNK